jgi:hypothetical protein
MAHYPIDNNFQYHAPGPEQIEKYVAIRKYGKTLAQTILDLCPDSRERSLALTYIEQAVMWANASIARNEAVTNTPV